MKKALVILFVAFLIVSVAGCASKGDDAESGSDMEAQVDIPNEEEKTAADDLTEEDSDDDSAATGDKVQKITFKKVEPKAVDETITDMEVYNTDSDLVVEKLVVIDKRDYEESTNWQVEALVRNEADQPIYFIAYFGDKDQDFPRYTEFKTLYGGESFWLKQLYINKNVYNLDNLPALCIVAHTTIMPVVSSDFTNFKDIGMHYSSGTDGCPFVDIESVDYVVNDESKGWTSAVVTLSSEQDVDVRVTFSGLGANEKVIIPAGKSVQVEAPIRGSFSPDDLTGIKISVL